MEVRFLVQLIRLDLVAEVYVVELRNCLSPRGVFSLSADQAGRKWRGGDEVSGVHSCCEVALLFIPSGHFLPLR